MIRYSYDNDNGGLEEVSLSGNVDTLTADIAFLISLVYGSIHQKSEVGAYLFKKNIEALCSDENINKTVFDPDLIEAAERSLGKDTKEKAEDEKETKKEHEDKKSDEERLKEDLRKLVKELLDL